MKNTNKIIVESGGIYFVLNEVKIDEQRNDQNRYFVKSNIAFSKHGDTVVKRVNHERVSEDTKEYTQYEKMRLSDIIIRKSRFTSKHSLLTLNGVNMEIIDSTILCTYDHD